VSKPSLERLAILDARVPGLDGIRAISIIVVFMNHSNLPQILLGPTGVTVFFFLSGYLITTLLRVEHERHGRINVGAFYLRRAFRIMPPMYLTLAAAVAISATRVLADDLSTGGVTSSSLFATNYWIIYASRDGLPTGMNALWSLAVEEHYYLLFPLLYIVMLRWLPNRRVQAAVLGGLCVAMLGWRCYLQYVAHAGFDRIYLATDTRGDSILLGAILAIVANPAFDYRHRMHSRHYWQCIAIGLILLSIARVLPPGEIQTIGYTIEGIACGALFTALIRKPDKWPGRILAWRPIAMLGVVSYSFYLTHRVILMLVAKYAHVGTYPTAACAFALSVVVSYLMYRLVEKPAARVRRRLHAPEKGAPRHRHTPVGGSLSRPPLPEPKQSGRMLS